MIKGFVLFIGPSSAGKTSILRRLVTGKFEHQEPTLGFSEENVAKVRIIEIGGQSTFRHYWKDAIDQNPVNIFFVIDVTKEKDYSEYVDFIEEYEGNYPQIAQMTVLTANKIDLVQKIPTHLNNVTIPIQCSAKTGEGMLDILEMIASHRNEAEAVIQPQRIEQSNSEQTINNDEEKAESILREFQGKF
ncbi:MAG: ADP-ribosylation factor-like protein [Promethearchaeota archaeon]